MAPNALLMRTLRCYTCRCTDTKEVDFTHVVHLEAWNLVGKEQGLASKSLMIGGLN